MSPYDVNVTKPQLVEFMSQEFDIYLAVMYFLFIYLFIVYLAGLYFSATFWFSCPFSY